MLIAKEWQNDHGPEIIINQILKLTKGWSVSKLKDLMIQLNRIQRNFQTHLNFKQIIKEINQLIN